MVSKFSKVITAGKKFGKSKAWDQNNPHFYALEHILIDIWAYEVHEISKIRMRLGFLSFFLMDLFFIPVSVVFGNWPKILLGLIIYIFLGSSLLLLGISFFTFLIILFLLVNIKDSTSFLVSQTLRLIEIISGGGLSRALADGLKEGGGFFDKAFRHQQLDATSPHHLADLIIASTELLSEETIARRYKLLNIYDNGSDSEIDEAFANYWIEVRREPKSYYERANK